MSRKFRKKQVEVEAMQLGPTSYRSIQEFCPGLQIVKKGDPPVPASATIPVPGGGHMRAELGDWIVKDEQGAFHPYRYDVFEQMYEEVS